MEMEKEREYGGIKLINTRLKSMTPKVHWLISLMTDEILGYHLRVFRALVGEQRGRDFGLKTLYLLTGPISHVAWTSRVILSVY